jgi:hypothetical protein
MRLTTRWPIVALALLSSCESGTAPQVDPPDNRGLLIDALGDGRQLAWSSDGSEVYIADLQTIRAVPAAGGPSRLVYTAPANSTLWYMSVSENLMYVSLTTFNQAYTTFLVRIDPASLQADTIARSSGSAAHTWFAVSQDGRFVSFADSLFDLTTAAPPRFLGSGHGWSFSPDDAYLVYQRHDPSGQYLLSRIATTDLSSVSLGTSSEIGPCGSAPAGAHYWKGAVPHLLHVRVLGSQATVFDRDLVAQSNRSLMTATADIAWCSAAAISTDGKRAVVVIGPLLEWSTIHAIDTETLVAREIATVASENYSTVQRAALSPDGTRVAYQVSDLENSGGVVATERVYVVQAFPGPP